MSSFSAIAKPALQEIRLLQFVLLLDKLKHESAESGLMKARRSASYNRSVERHPMSWFLGRR